ncbi:PREDICTED: beta-lactamase-like protein 2 isoform X2 [Ceratosolen solmsi marchali]|uniref:Beta-lactamase-like protein 2 homolog n=1 Tax=Ceratosolen solmsi marchali TaxID=326594 RepID=A0AAJ6YP16_9HYME|nr:PREDICTED: beta-lactamase-like protein 2 isoform X2 [Ceratosolen solmsi marchali]
MKDNEEKTICYKNNIIISRLSNIVIRILGCNPGPMTLQGTNTYLVGSGCKRVLIDSGDTHTAKQYITHLKQILTEENATIEHLILTHWHHDHVGGVLEIQNELKSLSSKQAMVWKFPRSINDPGGEEEEKFLGSWNSLKDKQFIEVEGAHLKIIHTPGHSTDHICLLLEEERVLFSGDSVLGESSAVFADLSDYLISLRKILKEYITLIYPGHGPVIENPYLKIQSDIDHRIMRENQIVEFLKSRKGQKHNVMDIVKFLYADTPKDLWLAAASNVTQHLKELLKENRVVNENELWFIDC